jgi:hypothetical protein
MKIIIIWKSAVKITKILKAIKSPRLAGTFYLVPQAGLDFAPKQK